MRVSLLDKLPKYSISRRDYAMSQPQSAIKSMSMAHDDERFLLDDGVLDGLLGEYAAAHSLLEDSAVSAHAVHGLPASQFDAQAAQWARTSPVQHEPDRSPSYSNGDTETASETASHSSSDMIVPPVKKPLTNSTRERIKQELSYLRSKVVALEHELTQLQQTTKTEKPHNDTNNANKCTSMNQRSLWERVARHQRVEKQKAERENEELREALENQLKLAKSLEKVLHKRPSAMLPQGLQDEFDGMVATNKRPRTGNAANGRELSTFDVLIERADASYEKLDEIWDRLGFSTSKDERNDTQVLLNSANRLYLEVINAKIVPFSLEATNRAAWMCISQPNLKFLNGVYRCVKITEDAIHASSEMSLKMGSGEARMQLAIVIKRFVEANRIVFVLETSSVSGGSKDVLHALQVVEKGWVVFEKVTDANGMESALMQVCMRLSPAITDSVVSRRPEGASTGVLTDLILSAFQQNLGFLYQTIENLLVDQMFKLASS